MPEQVISGGGIKPSEPKSEVKTRPVIFAIEICGKNNQNVLCPLDHTVSRGRWSRKNLVGQTPDEQFSSMPDLPGLVFLLNSSKRIIRRFDPLAQPENAKLLRRAQRVSQELLKQNSKSEPEKPRTWTQLSDDEMKSFAFWCLKLVDADLAVLVEGCGQVPTFDQIKEMPGIVMIEPFNSSASVEKAIPNERLRYRPPVAEEDNGFEGEGDSIPDPVVSVPGMSDDDDEE